MISVKPLVVAHLYASKADCLEEVVFLSRGLLKIFILMVI